jgi:hypothetical protein
VYIFNDRIDGHEQSSASDGDNGTVLPGTHHHPGALSQARKEVCQKSELAELSD